MSKFAITKSGKGAKVPAPFVHVMMVKRGNSFIVPNGQLELKVGDILLTIASQQA